MLLFSSTFTHLPLTFMAASLRQSPTIAYELILKSMVQPDRMPNYNQRLTRTNLVQSSWYVYFIVLTLSIIYHVKDNP